MPSGAATLSVSDANFDQEVLKSAEPVVVDFFAEWWGCRPWRRRWKR
jgi:thioredoxin 1